MSEIAPNSMGSPTSAEVQTFWDAAKHPSSRTVALAMQTAGWRISASTVGRIAGSGFKPHGIVSPRGRRTSAEINAVNQVRAIAVNAEPETVALAMVEAFRNLPAGASDRVKDLLDMAEEDIVKNIRKLYLIGGYLLAEDLAQHTKMMMLQPDKAAKLLQVLGTALSPLSSPIAPPKPVNGPTEIDHNPNEPQRMSVSAQAIADFRQKRGSAAA